MGLSNAARFLLLQITVLCNHALSRKCIFYSLNIMARFGKVFLCVASPKLGMKCFKSNLDISSLVCNCTSWVWRYDREKREVKLAYTKLVTSQTNKKNKRISMCSDNANEPKKSGHLPLMELMKPLLNKRFINKNTRLPFFA